MRGGLAGLLVLAFVSFALWHECRPALAQTKYVKQNRWNRGRSANWSALLSEPAAFVYRSHTRLRKRPEGFKPSATCSKYTGLAYLEAIRASRIGICSSSSSSSSVNYGDGSSSTSSSTGSTSSSGGSGGGGRRSLLSEAALPPGRSSVDCYTAPHITVGNSSKATISLCRSRNLLLDSCALLAGRRKGALSKKFPLPERGAVRLGGCAPLNGSRLAAGDRTRLGWLDSIHSDVWWANATRDDAAVASACGADSPNVVTTPTLFVMRDRHANYAHEMEVVSMAFAFLAALEPADVAAQGVQVVMTDQAPPTGFLETWARISQPHRLRVLAHDPFPPNTCFRSAYHVYTFAAGIGYNTNGDTAKCESAVVSGLSHWLRQLYDEGDSSARYVATSAAAETAAVAGPAAAAAGLTGLRVPAGGIVIKNVVWLSRRNLEMVRLLLNASAGWKAMRMVRNEDEVVSGLVAAVQEWNAESCFLRRFERSVKSEFERSFDHLNPVHGGAATVTAAGAAGASTVAAGARRSLLGRVAGTLGRFGRRLFSALRRPLQVEGDDGDGGSDGDGGEGGDDGDGGGDDEAEFDGGDGTGQLPSAGGAAGGNGTAANKTRPPYMIGNNIVALDKLWALDAAEGEKCRPTNVLFKFVDGDFSDMPYHQQLQTIFRTGVLAGVHGAGLTHGFFLPPGQSAVLQLLGDSFSTVAANNVFRNMAAGVGNHYEDVLYSGVEVDVAQLKAAAERSMDYVARKVMEAQLKRSGPLRLVLVDQNHFSVVVPPQETCPTPTLPAMAAAGVAGAMAAGNGTG